MIAELWLIAAAYVVLTVWIVQLVSGGTDVC